MDKLTKDAIEQIQEKAGNAAKNIVDSRFRTALEHLQRVCYRNDDGTGAVELVVKQTLTRKEDGKVGIKTAIEIGHKEVDRDRLDEIVIDPNQPLLDFDGESGDDAGATEQPPETTPEGQDPLE